MNTELVIRSLDAHHHTEEHFKEQIGLLYPLKVDKEKREITLLRTFVQVCQASRASMDFRNPGENTSDAWKRLDEFIEGGACGTFHTHPPLIFQWSSQDIATQNGLAKAFGKKRIWHGVQAASCDSVKVFGSEFVCCWMENGKVFRYVYKVVDDHLECPIIQLRMPPVIEWLGSHYAILDEQIEID